MNLLYEQDTLEDHRDNQPQGVAYHMVLHTQAVREEDHTQVVQEGDHNSLVAQEGGHTQVVQEGGHNQVGQGEDIPKVKKNLKFFS